MPIVTKPFIFSPGTLIQSAQVNSDFDTLYTLVNGQLDTLNISTIVKASTLSGKGYISVPMGTNTFFIQWDNTITTLAADGSAALSVTFATPFLNAVFFVAPHPLYTYAGSDIHVIAPSANWTVNGASLYGLGGDSGTTIAAGYIAIGY